VTADPFNSKGQFGAYMGINVRAHTFLLTQTPPPSKLSCSLNPPTHINALALSKP
jgi:hypothetical protein